MFHWLKPLAAIQIRSDPWRPSANHWAAWPRRQDCLFFCVQRALLQVSVETQTDRKTHGRPHGSTLTCANSRESILNDTYGIHRVDFPLMQIGRGLQMKDSQINKAAAASGQAELLCPHGATIMGCMPEREEDRRPASFARKVFFLPGVIKGVSGDQKWGVRGRICHLQCCCWSWSN